MAVAHDSAGSKVRKPRRIGAYCAVYGCSGRQADGISLHKFPEEPDTREHWIDFVKTCRAEFGPGYNTPNRYSFICERHFTRDCYPRKYQLQKDFGIPFVGKRLLPGAVPTIQKHAYSFSRIKYHAAPSEAASTATVATTRSKAEMSRSTMTYTASLLRPLTAATLQKEHVKKSKGVHFTKQHGEGTEDVSAKEKPGQTYRQPVLESPGPASSDLESLGPQPSLLACAPFPVLLIGPQEKQLLSRLCWMKPESSEENMHHSFSQPNLSTLTEELALPHQVKMEPEVEDEGDASSIYLGERDVNQISYKCATLSAEVKIEPVENDADTFSFAEQDRKRTLHDGVALPLAAMEVPVEELFQGFENQGDVQTSLKSTTLPVAVKMEPLELSDVNACLEERKVHRAPSEFAVFPIEVKMEPSWGYPDSPVQIKKEPICN